MSEELILRRVRTPGGAEEEVRIRGARIHELGADLAPLAGTEVIDASGCLLLPGLVNAHAHLDKTLWGAGWHPHRAGPSVAERIAYERRVLGGLGLSVEHQSARLVREMIALGTTHVRTHVDIDPGLGLSHYEAVERMREAHRDVLDIQIVAFPQSGVMVRPGTLDLLEQAVRAGARVVGGIDPIEIDRDPRGQLDGIFAIAERYGVEVDIHLHERGEMGAASLEMILERTGALGMRGRVVVSHAFCLGSVSAARFEALAARLAEQDIAIMSHGPGGGTPVPPVRALHERGVRVFSGTDGVRDAWGPLNSADMLERAYLVCYVNGFRDDAGFELALSMATRTGARVLGADSYGLEPGCIADMVLVPAQVPAEAVAAHPPRRLVIKNGTIVARDGKCLLPPLD